MGHRDLLVTHNLSQPSSNQRPFAAREASAAGRLRSSRLTASDHCTCRQFWEDYGLTGSYSGPEVLVLYRKRASSKGMTGAGWSGALSVKRLGGGRSRGGCELYGN